MPEIEDHDAEELTVRLDQRDGADYRRMEAEEYRLAERSDLPMVRAKHRKAAACWGQMAADRERARRRSPKRAGAAEQGLAQNG